MGIGLGQILIVFMLVLLFFGAKRLPEMTRDLGRATTEFKKANNKALYNNSNHDILRMPPEIEKQLPNAQVKKMDNSILFIRNHQ